MTDVLVLAGAVAVVYGLCMIFVPLGVVVAGLVLMCIGVGLDGRGSDGDS